MPEHLPDFYHYLLAYPNAKPANVAEKQLYSSHYFQAALDFSFCVRRSDDSKRPGFYLVMAMGSEQAGLTGVKGSVVRKAAVSRSVSNLQDALTNIRNTLEANK